MTQEDIIWWKIFRETNIRYFNKETDNMILQNDVYKMIAEIHARIKRHPVDYPCKCNPHIIIVMIDEIDNSYNEL